MLVGLSMGGRIVVEATLAAPERVPAQLLDAVLDGVPWDSDSERGIQAIGEGLLSAHTAPAEHRAADGDRRADDRCHRRAGRSLLPRDVRRLGRPDPGRRKVTVPGVGHMVNMEAPETVNAPCARWSSAARLGLHAIAAGASAAGLEAAMLTGAAACLTAATLVLLLVPKATGRSHRRPGRGNRDTTRRGPSGRRHA